MGAKKKQDRSTYINQPSALDGRIDQAVLVLVVGSLIVFALHQIVASDFWWQLKTGQWIRQHGFPVTDPFSYGFPGREWIEVRWLYTVVISLIYEWFGPNALIAAKVPWLMLAGVCLWLIGRGKPGWAVNIGLIAALLLAHQRFMIRPELVTMLFLSIAFLLLYRYHTTADHRWLLPLPVLQILWVNSHTLYILGPIVVVLFFGGEFIGEMLRRRNGDDPSATSYAKWKWPAIIAVASVAACLLNPYGLKGATFAFQLLSETMSDKALDGLIGELRGPLSVPRLNLFFISYIAAIAVSALGFILNKRSIHFGWLAIWGAFLVLSVMAERNVALFGLIAGVSIIVNFGSIEMPRKAITVARYASLVLLLVTIPLVASNYYYREIDAPQRFGFGVSVRKFPLRAVQFVEKQGLPVPLIAGLGDSSYPLFKYGPSSVYVDGRLEVYGPANAASGIKMFTSGDGLRETVERLGVRTLIANLESDGRLIDRLLKDAYWAPVYFDDSHIVFLADKPETRTLIERFKIDWANVKPSVESMPDPLSGKNILADIVPSVGDSRPSRTLAQLYGATGNIRAAQPFLEDAVKQWPNDQIACFQLGSLYKAQKRDGEAAKLFDKVSDEVKQDRNNQIFAAFAYEAFGNMAAAAQAWSNVVKLGDAGTAVYERMAESAVRAESWDVAFTAYNALAADRPNDIQVLNNLGTIANILGKRAEAVTALERSLNADPKQAETAIQLGMTKQNLGDINGAKEAFNRALAADPINQAAIKALNDLDSRGSQPR